MRCGPCAETPRRSTARTCAFRPWARARTTRPSFNTWACRVLNLSFGGEGGGGSYHSLYDSFDHYVRFGDPDFRYGVALAQVAGRTTLRLANADVLPYRFSGLADNVRRYLEEVEKLEDDMRRSTERNARLAEVGAWELAADPTQTYVAPEPKASVPHLNFAPVQNAVALLDEAAARYDAAMARALTERGPAPDLVQPMNARVRRIEQLLSDERGLPKRPWFRHQIYAPGFYTGYGVKTLPGVREAIEERDWDLVDVQMERLAAALRRAAESIGEGARMLEASSSS